ncbi:MULTISPECIES: hypothetical protein [Bacillus cereus group]|uniref:Uncharacterized protein n=1 Tax=Bacillus cereus TaxID=1396 RepID=A0A1Q4L4D1_BACCE|nr:MULTISPECIES: hypothetical protein [Bacillus cereus group]EJP83484.1 hypothetical protein IAU_05464 [Bacillus cereus IS075]EOO82447.1 hypothetical protein IGS_05804 [Bacillus cereus IS845/00]EOO92550.1 hypothetical protein IGQ_05757 [Bacillus cereus IS195]MDX5927868.1 hypothetical protein [Bacillus cereus group sp. BfR-BA-00967]MDX5974999.1 hypothetical protein [Bacillus cereus group sp. BfR-BA-00287]
MNHIYILYFSFSIPLLLLPFIVRQKLDFKFIKLYFAINFDEDNTFNPLLCGITSFLIGYMLLTSIDFISVTIATVLTIKFFHKLLTTVPKTISNI